VLPENAEKNRRIGMGWRSGERASRIIQRSDGVGGRQPGLRALRQASLVVREEVWEERKKHLTRDTNRKFMLATSRLILEMIT
jgi:hypothetical protein